MSKDNILYLVDKLKKSQHELIINNIRAERSNISKQGEHPVPKNTKCSQCNIVKDIMYSRCVFKNGELNFCSRDCVIKWGHNHPL